ncbi:hypothetical protein KUH03_22420 [Sphingobacterium sp. E70]|uniref:hypothetical protein n=1 Tax=Sphingobacterium sp. E70 TaxID=2853439 RepID=UPI00211CC3F8|nr:hypothetical protein [Sphingobacterium sp. E70]ULT22223.1 hypothetical protein KUH03_22420 [Sphingobacterium sp. E70]
MASIKQKSSPFIAVKPVLNNVLTLDSVQKFTLQLAKPSPNTFKLVWSLNNEAIAHDIDSIYLDPGMLNIGANELKVIIQDTTDLLRDPKYVNHRDSIVWKFNQLKSYELAKPINTWGDTLETCFGGDQVITVKKPIAGLVYHWFETLTAVPIGTGNNVVIQKVSASKNIMSLHIGKTSIQCNRKSY